MEPDAPTPAGSTDGCLSVVLAGVLGDLDDRSGCGPWVLLGPDEPPRLMAGSPVPGEGTPDQLLAAAQGAAAIPLAAPDGQTLGILCPLTLSPGGPSPDAQAAAGRLARLLVQLLDAEWRAEQSRLRAERAEAESLMDPVTRVASRRAWELALAAEEGRCARYGSTAAVVVVDLDDLKLINDSEGHLSGDMALAVTGQVLTRASRDADLVARVGGDEFAILVPHCDEPDLDAVLARLTVSLAQEGVHASLGGAVRRQLGMVGAWEEADGRMYDAKRRRKRERTAEGGSLGRR